MKLTLDDVESRTSVGASTLSEFENDKREPRLPQLKELADLYCRATSFFLDDGPLPQEIVLWRQKPKSPIAEELQSQLLRLGNSTICLRTGAVRLKVPNFHSQRARPSCLVIGRPKSLLTTFATCMDSVNGPDSHCCELLKKSAKSKCFTWRLSQVAVQPAR